MDIQRFCQRVRENEREFPPSGHFIRDIAIDGDKARLHIAPKPGFSGEPRQFEIAISDNASAVMLSMMRAGFFSRLYERVEGHDGN